MTLTYTKNGKLTKRSLRSLLSAYRSGRMTKTQIERMLGRHNDKGKFITRLWASELGVDTRFARVNERVAA